MVLGCRGSEIGRHPGHRLGQFRHLALEGREDGVGGCLLAVEAALHSPHRAWEAVARSVICLLIRRVLDAEVLVRQVRASGFRRDALA